MSANPNEITVSVYIDDSRIYTYTASAPTPEKRQAKARDHMHAMGRNGLVAGPSDGELEYIPPHRITKIKVAGDFADSKYGGSWGGA